MTPTTPPRITPTHFIEVWKGISGEINDDSRGEISDLKCHLRATKSCGFETVAIFKIKLKQ